VKSHITARFRKAFAGLPDDLKRQSRAAYRLFRANPQHPSLRFKQVHANQPIYSVRIGLGYRALAVRDGDDLIWFWIGSHADYDTLIAAR
jgi:hypothetical protein